MYPDMSLTQWNIIQAECLVRSLFHLWLFYFERRKALPFSRLELFRLTWWPGQLHLPGPLVFPWAVHGPVVTSCPLERFPRVRPAPMALMTTIIITFALLVALLQVICLSKHAAPCNLPSHRVLLSPLFILHYSLRFFASSHTFSFLSRLLVDGYSASAIRASLQTPPGCCWISLAIFFK